MTVDSDWAVAEAVPQYASTKQVRAARIMSAAPISEFESAGFDLTLEGVAEPYRVAMDKWVGLGAGIGGFIVFADDAEAAAMTLEAFEAEYELVEEP